MGATSPDNLPWPPGYAGVPADVPADIQKLAEATQAALNKKRVLPVPYSGWTRPEDFALAADTHVGITFTTQYTQPAGTTAAVSAVWVPAAGGHTSHTNFTVLAPGLHTLELDMSLSHATAGTAKPFEMGLADSSDNPITSAEFSIYMATAGRSVRIRFNLTQNFTGTFHAYVKPIGATGWSMKYARFALIGV